MGILSQDHTTAQPSSLAESWARRGWPSTWSYTGTCVYQGDQ